jgi:hypothetical protein
MQIAKNNGCIRKGGLKREGRSKLSAKLGKIADFKAIQVFVCVQVMWIVIYH